MGVMGGPMVRHLRHSGAQVTVWSRRPEPSHDAAEHGAIVAKSLGDLAADVDAAVMCVTRSEDVEACLTAMLFTAKPGTLFIDHSTIAPDAAVRLHALAQAAGCPFVDAPVTGGSMGAVNGTLTVFMGGEADAVERAKRVCAPYAKRMERVGGAGAGQRMKVANQIAVAGALLGMCESLGFVKRAGLDVAQAIELIGSGAGGSWAMQHYGPKVLSQDWTPGFTIDNQLKDFEYCRRAGAEVGAPVPTTELCEDLLKKLQESGHGHETTAALYRLFAGEEIPG